MTIESTLERIAISNERIERLLERLIDLTDSPIVQNEPVPAAPVPVPVPVAPASVPAPVPTPAPTPAPAPVPAFVPPVPPAAAPALPFNDSKSLIAYCMEKYRTLGPVKGGLIQSILLELGASNIATLPEEKFATFFAKVEAL